MLNGYLRARYGGVHAPVRFSDTLRPRIRMSPDGRRCALSLSEHGSACCAARHWRMQRKPRSSRCGRAFVFDVGCAWCPSLGATHGAWRQVERLRYAARRAADKPLCSCCRVLPFHRGMQGCVDAWRFVRARVPRQRYRQRRELYSTRLLSREHSAAGVRAQHSKRMELPPCRRTV